MKFNEPSSPANSSSATQSEQMGLGVDGWRTEDHMRRHSGMNASQTSGPVANRKQVWR